jgi:hypothetical protein
MYWKAIRSTEDERLIDRGAGGIARKREKGGEGG